MHPIASRFTPPARPTPYTLHAYHRRAFAGPNSWPRHHSSFPDSAHLPGTANAAPRLSRPPSHTFLAIVLALVPLLQTSKMHHDDREMSALGPGTDQLVTIPIPLRQRRSVGCFTYPRTENQNVTRVLAASCGSRGRGAVRNCQTAPIGTKSGQIVGKTCIRLDDGCRRNLEDDGVDAEFRSILQGGIDFCPKGIRLTAAGSCIAAR